MISRLESAKEKLEQEEILKRILEYRKQEKASLKADKSVKVSQHARSEMTPGASSSGGITTSPILAQRNREQAVMLQQATGAMMQMMQQIQFVLAHSGALVAAPLLTPAATSPPNTEWHHMSEGDLGDWEHPEQ